MIRILAVPIMIFLVVLQSSVFSSLTLLGGTADIVMLTVIAWAFQERTKSYWEAAALGGLLVGYVSAIPVYVPLIGYLLVTFLARILQRRVWQTPILVMFFTTVIGSLMVNFLSIFSLQLSGVPLNFSDSISLVVLPSALLNLILSFPIYLLVKDVAEWIYPSEE